jgi:flagellar biosynthetic protein FlhB
VAEGSKTEKATPKKRRDERKKGNVFLSKDAVSVATLIGAYGALRLTANTIADQLSRFMQFCLSGEVGEGNMIEILMQAIKVLVLTAGPIIAVTVVCAVVGTFAQTKFLVSGESIKPKADRISPIQGFKRLFSLRSVVEALKGVLKIALLMYLVYLTLREQFTVSSHYLYTDISVAAAHVFQVANSLLLHIIIAFIALAALDFLYQWWEYERQMKMTKQEVKDEYKQVEGDPQVKGKIKEMQRQRAQSRMMQQVPQADVVIRNPTHFAVALRYRPNVDSAPIVLAKGQDELALRIVKVAEENGVAVMENVPLARALYANTDLNREIPPELYGAVAEVLVYIFKLSDSRQLVKDENPHLS